MSVKHLKKEETGRKWCFTVGGGGQRGGTRYNTHDTRDIIRTVHAALEKAAIADTHRSGKG